MKRFEETTQRIDNSPVAKKLNITTKEFLGMVVNAFLIVVLAMSTYVTVDSTFNIDWSKLGFTSLFVYLISCVIYSNSLNLGESAVAKKEDYKQTVKDCITSIDTLVKNKFIEHIDEYCLAKQKQDLESRRKTVLSTVYVSWEKYESDYSKKSIKELKEMTRDEKSDNSKEKANKKPVPYFNREQLRAISKARRMKCHKFSPQQLTRPIDAKSEEFLEDIAKLRRKVMARKMLMSLILTLIAVNFSVGLVSDFTYKTVVESVVKLIPMAWSWASGHFTGYNITINNKMAYYKDKARYCTQANNWLNEKYGKEVESI